ncbi:MAG TPA: ComEA family DNA-binding protein [Candidatus Caenarcaniphilales bacterium]
MTLNNWLSFVRSPQQSLNLAQAHRLADPHYRFRSLEEVELAAALGVRIDVNQASVDDWLRLPGLSIHQARLLVQLTQSGVQFHCLEDLAAVLRLPLARLKPWESILQFCYYDPESVCVHKQVNPNTASIEALVEIPLIDSALAKAVVYHRLAAGPYRDLADLQQRLFLPGELTTELIHYLYF